VPGIKEQANKPVLRAALRPDRACTIAIQALCRGPFDWRVRGVTGAAARQGTAHIALRYARVLLYLEDRAALDALVAAGKRPTNWARRSSARMRPST
jgi:hypothetical protein